MADTPRLHRILLTNSSKLDFLRISHTDGLVPDVEEDSETLQSGSQTSYVIEESDARLVYELRATSIHWYLHVDADTVTGDVRVGFSENPEDPDERDLVKEVSAVDWDDFGHTLELCVASQNGEVNVVINEERESGGWCAIL